MITVARAEGLRLVIYLNDHEPAHVHVIGDGEAKVNLLGPDDAPELVWADKMSRGDIRRAMRVVGLHRAFLVQRWNDIHG